MLKVKVNSKNALRDLKKYRKKSLKKVEKAVAKNTLEIEANAKRTAPVDTGLFRATITSIVGKYKGEVFSNAPYVESLELIKPGEGKLSPESPLTSWPTKQKKGNSQAIMPAIRTAHFNQKEKFEDDVKRAVK